MPALPKEDLSECYRSLVGLSVEETHFQIIAKACDGSAVKPETLIENVSPLPATFNPDAGTAWMIDLFEKAKKGEMEEDEARVMQRCIKMFVDFMRQLLEDRKTR